MALFGNTVAPLKPWGMSGLVALPLAIQQYLMRFQKYGIQTIK